MTTTTMETHSILSWSGLPMNLTDIRQGVFGHLARLAAPIIEHYHSDLYWDAMWIEKHLTADAGDTFSFYFSIDNCGTLIGTDAELVLQRKNAYRMTAKAIDGKGTLTIEPLADAGEVLALVNGARTARRATDG
jgi:hypothetical protein